MRVKALRSALRRRRADLPRGRQSPPSSLQIARHLWHLPALARCQRIACYLAVGGEVDCTPIMAEALARRRQVYLPVLHGRIAAFAPWDPAATMVPQSLRHSRASRRSAAAGCAGPSSMWCLRHSSRSTTPGHRLGMGGGFYDRTLRFLRQRGRWRTPLFIGLAHEFQRVAALPIQPWDVALHAVVTECGAIFLIARDVGCLTLAESDCHARLDIPIMLSRARGQSEMRPDPDSRNLSTRHSNDWKFHFGCIYSTAVTPTGDHCHGKEESCFEEEDQKEGQEKEIA